MESGDLKAKWKGEEVELVDAGTRGAGRLVARMRGEDGFQFFFQYFDSKGKRQRLPIGAFDEKGARGLTLQDARDKASTLSQLYRVQGIKDLHQHFARERAAQADAQAAADAAKAKDAKRGTVKELLTGYAKTLKPRLQRATLGGGPNGGVGMFQQHIYGPHPDLAERKAATVTAEEWVKVFFAMIDEDGETGGSQAQKCREYVHAAYESLLKKKLDATAPTQQKADDFGVTINPIARIEPMRKFKRSDKRKLNAAEIGAFMRRFRKLKPGLGRDGLEALIFLGGQRGAQLYAMRPVDVDLQGMTATTFDSKGDRDVPVEHTFPITKRVAAIIKRRLDMQPADAKFVFSATGTSPLKNDSVNEMVGRIVEEMLEAKETRAKFTLKHFRKASATQIAAMGVPKDVIDNLQSRNLGTVQNEHYNFHKYMAEMFNALTLWEKFLDQVEAGNIETATVTPLWMQKKAA